MDELHGVNTMERTMMARAAARRMPVSGSMELLPLCNMNCDMCYVRLSRAEMEAQGRLRSAEEWLTLGAQMARMGVLFLLLTGGEPLLHPGFKEIYLGLRKLGMILTVNTNAALIDEQWADFFAQHKPRRVNITLYGTGNDEYERLCHYPGGFDRVIRAIRLLRARQVDVRMGFSVTPANESSLKGFLALAKELDCAIISDAYMSPSSRERSRPFEQQNRLLPEAAAQASMTIKCFDADEKQIAESARKMVAKIDAYVPGEKQPCESSCMAGRCSFTVNWQGLLRPCVLASEPEANAFDLGFERAWKQVSGAFLKRRYCADCSVCPVRELCRVCPVACKAETGDYLGRPEYLCRYAKETERLLRELAENC
ncbi:MAG: radical SAM protein [Clostridia bacterium]|nr:radical SAM protein [Clostridia bacterium]